MYRNVFLSCSFGTYTGLLTHHSSCPRSHRDSNRRVHIPPHFPTNRMSRGNTDYSPCRLPAVYTCTHRCTHYSRNYCVYPRCCTCRLRIRRDCSHSYSRNRLCKYHICVPLRWFCNDRHQLQYRSPYRNSSRKCRRQVNRPRYIRRLFIMNSDQFDKILITLKTVYKVNQTYAGTHMGFECPLPDRDKRMECTPHNAVPVYYVDSYHKYHR